MGGLIPHLLRIVAMLCDQRAAVGHLMIAGVNLSKCDLMRARRSLRRLCVHHEKYRYGIINTNFILFTGFTYAGYTYRDGYAFDMYHKNHHHLVVDAVSRCKHGNRAIQVCRQIRTPFVQIAISSFPHRTDTVGYRDGALVELKREEKVGRLYLRDSCRFEDQKTTLSSNGGHAIWAKDGSITLVRYLNRSRHRVYKWDRNGHLIKSYKELSANDDGLQRHGSYISWHPCGKVKTHAKYMVGRLHGLKTKHDPDGNCIYSKRFKYGIIRQ